MDKIPTPRGAGCLICLVQASDSMRATAYTGPAKTKIAAALRVVDRLIDDLVQFLAEPPARATALRRGRPGLLDQPGGQAAAPPDPDPARDPAAPGAARRAGQAGNALRTRTATPSGSRPSPRARPRPVQP